MEIDIDKYRTDDAMKTLTGSVKYDTNSWLYKAGIVPLLARLFVSMFRWYFWKYAFYLALMAIGISVFSRDRIATNLANDGYISAFELIAKDKGIRSTLTNQHPAYHSPAALRFRDLAGFDMQRLFWFVDAGGEELLVKRDVFRRNEIDRNDPSKEPYLIERYNFVGLDAMGFCSGMGGTIPENDHFLNFLTDRMRVKAHPGEMTQNSKRGEKLPFRCVINAEHLMEMD
jgi:hypothetical protein